jgi:hypothetical protein
LRHHAAALPSSLGNRLPSFRQITAKAVYRGAGGQRCQGAKYQYMFHRDLLFPNEYGATRLLATGIMILSPLGDVLLNR